MSYSGNITADMFYENWMRTQESPWPCEHCDLIGRHLCLLCRERITEETCEENDGLCCDCKADGE